MNADWPPDEPEAAEAAEAELDVEPACVDAALEPLVVLADVEAVDACPVLVAAPVEMPEVELDIALEEPPKD